MKQYWVYIMTNKGNAVLYTGLTNNLTKRAGDHKQGKGSQFTRRYKLTKLVYYERFNRILDAITAEKRVKGGSRAKKIRLIESMNPQWEDLFDRAFA